MFDTCLSQLTDMILDSAENGKQNTVIILIKSHLTLYKIKSVGISDKTIKFFTLIIQIFFFASLGTVFLEAVTIPAEFTKDLYWDLSCFCYT